MHRALPALAPLTLALLAPASSAQSEPADFQRPAYKFLRQDEDWSGLRGRDRTTTGDCFDPIKYVPLDDRGDVWLSFGGDLRARGEVWNGFNFGAPPSADNDDAFLLTRVLVHGDLHVGESFRLFAQGKSALGHDRDLVGGDRLLDEDPAELQQLFFDWKPEIGGERPLTIRPGRQMFVFGKQRLVSPLPWGNALRSWDGISVTWADAGWKATGFFAEFDPVDQNELNEPDGGTRFYGIYATRAGAEGRPGLDLYWLGLGLDDAAYNGTVGDEERQSVGARLFGSLGGDSEYDVEGTYQFGEVGDSSISAWSFASELGFHWREAAGKPRAWLGLDYASGDSSSGGSVNTFNQLFPLAHPYFGYADQIARQNIIDLSLFGQVSALDTRFELSGHSFWAADTSDALYNAGGLPFRAAGSYSSRHVGLEVDATATRKLGRHTTAQVGYSHLFPGDAIEESGPSEDIDFAYVSLEYSF